MHQRLRNDHRLVVTRETTRTVLGALDPEGVSKRRKGELQRRRYMCKGPNYLWHMDGYDKMKPYGFCIHGAIEGYSRRILWLEVDSTNNDPAVIAQYYIDCVNQLGGAPRIVWADYGTECRRCRASEVFPFRGHCWFCRRKEFSLWTIICKPEDRGSVVVSQKG